MSLAEILPEIAPFQTLWLTSTKTFLRFVRNFLIPFSTTFLIVRDINLFDSSFDNHDVGPGRRPF
jgi:hypothetical protein